jgi:hypothetical protein
MAKTPTETTSTPTRKITIQGEMFSVADKYAEGDTINALEAAALNQTRSENLRNNMASEVKKLKEALGEGETLSPEVLAELQTKLDDYAASYVFSAGGGRTTDPIDKEAKLIATTILDGLLAKNGIKKGDYQKDGKYDAKLTEIAGKAEVRADAEKRVAERNAMASSISLG